MTLTKRQWIMFTLFIIELGFVLFNAALFQNILVISSSLSTILFLGALYLEHNPNSNRLLLLAAVWLIVNAIFSMIPVIPSIFSSFNLVVLLDVVITIMLYVGIYKFAMKFYQRDFYNKKENVNVTLLVIPTILIGFYFAYQYFSAPILGGTFDIIYALASIISSMIIPLAIVLYTWLRHKNIQ